MDDHVWLAGWYATKLHAVPIGDLPSGQTAGNGVCGAWVYAEPRTDWAARRVANGLPRCRHCERKLSQPNSTESDLARVTAERDRWKRLAEQQSEEVECAREAATRYAGALSLAEAERDRLREALELLVGAADALADTCNASAADNAINAARAALNGEG